jgi:hypothetical protein
LKMIPAKIGSAKPAVERGRVVVEQLTLNHRVPGSSPGAPTNDFKHLAVV